MSLLSFSTLLPLLPQRKEFICILRRIPLRNIRHVLIPLRRGTLVEPQLCRHPTPVPESGPSSSPCVSPKFPTPASQSPSRPSPLAPSRGWRGRFQPARDSAAPTRIDLTAGFVTFWARSGMLRIFTMPDAMSRESARVRMRR
ncbi:hypothetical protein VUR80DRAFT_6657 [Thermomyces stellatus]